MNNWMVQIIRLIMVLMKEIPFAITKGSWIKVQELVDLGYL